MAYAQLFGRDDQVTVKNPRNRDYIFQWDGRKYLIRANAEQPMPGWMAEHYVKEMTNLLMQENGENESLMRETARLPYYHMLVISHSKMAPLDANKPDGDITILGEEASPGPTKKKGLKLADATDALIDEELDIDSLPRDEDLYPAPKKTNTGKRAKAKNPRVAKDKDDLAPGELAADAAGDLDDEPDADTSDLEDGDTPFEEDPK